MGFWEWMGFENPRDSPKTEQPKEGLPQVTDNVRDSGQTFVFGRSNAGEQVDEKAAMQIPTVYACVRLLAESIAALPLHLYRVTDDNGNKEKARDHPLYKILYRQPNPEMTSFVFWETLMTHLLLWGNAYAQIVRDGKNTVLGLYPLLPENVEVDRDESGELYYIYHAYTDEVPGEQNKDITIMAVTKKIEIDGKEVTFKASAAVPRLYRIKFGRDIYKDLRQLEKSVGENDEDNSNLDLFSLEMFEDLAWLMARHADPANVPDSPEEFLDQFNTFSIYQILPQLIELWGLNVQTEVESRKNLAKVSGK